MKLYSHLMLLNSKKLMMRSVMKREISKIRSEKGQHL